MTDHLTQNGNAVQANLFGPAEAGFTTLPDRSFLHVTGEDAGRWLNGMVTNAAQALRPGEGNYNFLLNAQGRIQGDCLLYREPAAQAEFLLVTDTGQGDTVQRHLDKYIIMDDVELTPVLLEQQSLVLLGTGTSGVLRSLNLPLLDPLRLESITTSAGNALMFTPFATAFPRVEFRGPATVIEGLRNELGRAEVAQLSADALEQIRMLQAVPRFGTDIRERELPQETGQEHALHFAKGCYLGQEIVERIRSRGQVHRRFTALRLEGALPQLPTPLEANGSPVGELTSAVEVPVNGRAVLLGLGYVRREALEAHALLSYAGGTAVPRKPGKIA